MPIRALMTIVEIPVNERKVAARLVAMRTWLYKKKCDPVRLETGPEQSGIVLIRAEFQAEHLAEAFRRTFDPRAAHFAAL